MNRATSATGWVRNPVMKSPELDPRQASSYELGWTYNPITGCRNHVDGLCKGGGFPCYAYRLAHGRLKARYLANTNLAPDAKGGVSTLSIGNQSATEREGDYADPFYPRFWEERLYHQWVGEPKGIFVCDMGELFGDWIPKEWTHRIAEVIVDNPWHRFYLLTKQPQELIKWSPFPENCWVGVTVTSGRFYGPAWNYLDRIKAKVKYVSFEPLLGDIERRPLLDLIDVVDWVIIGAQTKPYKPPKIEWVQGIVEAADKAGIPVFLKDNLKPLLEDDPFNPLYWRNICDDERGLERADDGLRQEVPI